MFNHPCGEEGGMTGVERQLKISVVIPAYNERDTILEASHACVRFLCQKRL